MLGVVGDLKGVAGIVGGEIRDEHERLARALLLIVHRDAVSLDLGHANLPALMRIAFSKRRDPKPIVCFATASTQRGRARRSSVGKTEHIRVTEAAIARVILLL